MKATLKWVLALILIMAMAASLLPAAGLLTVSASADEFVDGNEEEKPSSLTYYVATTGSDKDGDGSAEKPFATIQKALNTVEEDNTIPTTIWVADGAYNVYVPYGSENDVVADNNNAARGHTLMIARNNVTLKAVNPGKAILYSYMDPYPDTASQHCYSNTVRFGYCENFTMDGFTVLPSFVKESGYSFTSAVKVQTVMDYVNSLLPGVTTDFAGNTTVYLNNNNPMIQANSYYKTPSNGTTKTISGLTITNCNLGYKGQPMSTLVFDYTAFVGDYHLTNNVFNGAVYIKSNVGSEAAVTSRIENNVFSAGLNISGLTTSDGKGKSFEQLPTVVGNTFTGAIYTAYDLSGNGVKGLLVCYDLDGYLFTAGDMSVIAQTNYDGNGNSLAYRMGLQGKTATGAMNNAAVLYATTDVSLVDTVIDTEEELAYALTQAGMLTLSQDFVLTASLPENMQAKLVLNGFTVKKSAEVDSPAPVGYCWYDGIDLAAHTPSAELVYDELTHWNPCTNCDGRANEVAHTPEASDGKCTTIIRCTVCNGVVSYGADHTWDNDCTTDDVCAVVGCGIRATKQAAHTFSEHDSTCNYPGCAGTQPVTHVYAAELEHDTLSHWKVCIYPECNERFEESRHTAAADDGDCTTDICCAACGEVMVEGNDSHVVNRDCTVRSTCTNPGCYVVLPASSHVYSHDHDVDCNTPGCTGTREPIHTAGAEWLFDDYLHWNACTGEGCEVKLNVTPHTRDTVLSYNGGYHWYACTQEGCNYWHDSKAHSWDSDCTTADVCTVEGCNAVAAAAEIHSWDKDCTSADECKTLNCTVKATPAEAHVWDSDCTTRDVCQTPGCAAYATAFEEHSWDRDCMTADPCTVCGVLQEPFNHDGWDNDCTTFNICEECRQVSPAASAHDYDCTTNGKCKTEGCTAQAAMLKSHKFDKDCSTADRCSRCTVFAKAEHTYDDDGVCTVCKAVEDEGGEPNQPNATTPGTSVPTPNNNTIVIVVIAVAAVVVIAAVVTVVIVLKKSKKADRE